MKKYHKVLRYGSKGSEEVVENLKDITVWEKIDGCFHYTTPILLSDGTTLPIGRIVKNKMEVEVMSYNFNKQQFEPRKVVNWYNHGKQKDFIAFEVSSRKGSRANRVICTPDHLFYTDEGYVEARKLTPKHKMYTYHAKLSETQRQFFLGTLLGDSSAYPNKKSQNNGIVYSHSNTQVEYKRLKDFILDSFYSGSDEYIYGYGSTGERGRSVCSLATSEVVDICYIDNVKTVTRKWLDELTPIGLSFWYMDDGSLVHNESQRDRATLHTQGFSEKEIDTIVQYLLEKWGIKSNKIWNKSGHYISLNTDGSDKFFTLIAPYIHQSMQYKLPKEYRSGYSYWDGFKEVSNNGLVEIKFKGFVDIPDYLTGLDNFDIEVEGNHNYIASGALAHNSNASFRVVDGEVKCYSRNQELSEENNLRGFHQWVRDNIDPLKLDDTLIYFGEWLQPHTIRYHEDAYGKFYLFDVYDTFYESYCSTETCVHVANSLGVMLAPILYQGKFKSVDHIKSFVGHSELTDNEGEGVVVKDTDLYLRNGQQWLKFVSEAFQEKKKVKIKDQTKKDSMDLFVESTLTEARVEKLLLKLVDEGVIEEGSRVEDMGIILKNSASRIVEDILEEEKADLIKLVKQRVGKAYPKVVKDVIRKREEAQ